MIDMHTHWKPAEVADALRARTREPRILRNDDGAEVLKDARMGDMPLTKAFDDADLHLTRMDRQGVTVSVLSLLGSFCWVEAQPPEVSGPLCRRVNEGLSAICEQHPDRFAAFAALPLTDMSAAAAAFEHALGLPGMIGAQVPGNLLPHPRGCRSGAPAAGGRQPPPRGVVHPPWPSAGRRFSEGRARRG